MCSNQTRGCFLVYLVTFVIRNLCVQNKREAAFLVYSVTLVIRNMCVQSEREVALVIRKMNVYVFLVFVLSYKYSCKIQVTKRLFSLVDEKCV